MKKLVFAVALVGLFALTPVSSAEACHLGKRIKQKAGAVVRFLLPPYGK